MSSLRIVYACPFFDPAFQFGGPVTQLSTMCRTLAQRGHAVQVVTTDVGVTPDVERDRWLEKDGYRVYYARSSRLGRVPPYYNWRVRPALEQALSRADVLDMQSMFTHLNHVARQAAARQRVPFVVTPRQALAPVYLQHKRWEKRVFLRLWERRLLRDASAVHALHEYEAQQIAKQAPTLDKTFIIPNACGLAGRQQWPSADAFRTQLALSARTPLVLFMGRLHVLKGLDLLCRAFVEVIRQVPDAVLVLAGHDEGGSRLVRAEAPGLLERGAIRLVGQLQGELKLSALRAAHVFTLTSRSEGIPNAVLEALSAGAPCVITEECHIPAVAERGAGRVVKLDSPDIARALIELLKDAELRARCGQNAAAHAAAALRPEHIAVELEALYRHCAAQRA
jgi:glycosyltransferase involved in cell wall biosynthesis